MHDEHDHSHDHPHGHAGDQSGSPWLDRVNDAYYDRLGEDMGRRTRDRINWMCAQCSGDTVLDIGCSQGITSILLGREGFHVTGIDIAPEAIAFAARELAAEPPEVRSRVDFRVLDLMSLPAEATFDNVVLGEVVEHQTSASRFVGAAAALVAPGGRMVVTVPFGLHPFPDHKCTVFPRDLADTLGAAFSFERLEVVGGYIRVVAVRAAGSAERGATAAMLLAATEAGTLEAQERYFELLRGSRQLQAVRKDLDARLKSLRAKHDADVLQSGQTESRLREEAAQLRNQVLAMRSEALRVEEQVQAQARAIEQAGHRAADEQRKLADATSALAEAAARFEALQAEHGAQRRGQERRIAQAVEQQQALDAELRKARGRIAQMVDYRRRLEHQHATVKHWLNDATQELSALKGSVAFRAGQAITGAARSPRDLLALPLRLGRLFASGLRRRAARKALPEPDPLESDPGAPAWRHPRARKPAGTAQAGTGPAESAHEAPAPRLEVSGVVPVELEDRQAITDAEARAALPAPTPARPCPQRLADVRVAAIMDDFTYESFRHACQLRQLSPETWRAELDAFQPHVLFVESAWRGGDGRWSQKVYPLSRELVELVEHARQAGIPTVFWNKEDPVHFSVFLATARLFDHVFTTDVDSIRSYRVELGHDRVHLLPFACAPQVHNPIETRPRKEGFCFAGSYYAKYPERQRDFASLMEALREVAPVDIYDRNHGKDEPSLAFPEAFLPLIRGSLPYDRIDVAYKGYRFGININTVKQSQSMFARRAFDLLGSNTVTVSNFSRGLRLLFGDLVVSTDQGAEAVRRLRPLLDDEQAFRKHRLLGLRKVLGEHTYDDRLGFVLEKVFGRRNDPALPEVVVVARPAGEAACRRVLAAFARQSYPRRRLVLVDADGSAARAAGDAERVQVVGAAEAARLRVDADWQGCFVACFEASDYYGPAYLTDLVLATRFSPAVAIGKASHYAGAGGAAVLVDDGRQYTTVDALALRAAIVAASALPWALADLPERIADGAGGLLAVDEFNYCRDWNDEACAPVDDPVLWTGIDLATLQEMAERRSAAGTRAATRLRGLGPEQLAQLFPPGEHANGRVQVTVAADGIGLASTLGEGRHAYVYADQPVPVEVLFPDEIGRFNLRVASSALLSVTLIFLDEGMKRVGHVIRACNANQSVVPLPGTRYVTIGIRVQGPGLASVGQLVLQHVPPAIDALAGTARHLVVSRSYPSYDNLYSYTFVHRRVLGYRDAGLRAEVFRFSELPFAHDEFEDVDVVGGNVGDLALMLESNPYDTILVHSFDEQVWSAIEPHLARTRVVVWVHGAEIQPWYRRDFNFADEGERRRGIQRSDMRMGLWRQVLADMPANLHLVFVSEFLARQAMRDLGVTIPRDRYSVIHNFVDGELFDYRPKPAAQRHRILSIRPYSKPTYANDLAVKAILDLRDEPWFGDLEFRLVGDGPLFEPTVEPLRGLPNVTLERRFLAQRQIRDLHKDYGVLLVPSRIDSQGVSRDEAMASGLVPVTNAVSAIPEFVDASVAMLAPREDWRGLADGIRALHADPERFLRMSAAAAAHVRAKTGRDRTLAREVALVRDGAAGDAPPPAAATRRIAVYADLNFNLIDGSAVWAASLVQVLAGVEGVEVDLFLKARLRTVSLLEDVLEFPNVRLVEPGQGGDVPPLDAADALAGLVAADAECPYDAIVLRGYRVSLAAAREAALRGRLWIYLTDIPQDAADLDAEWRDGLGEIGAAARHVLCQTAPLEALLQEQVPAMRGRTRRLPPMIPRMAVAEEPAVAEAGEAEVLRIVYAGKFAPAWGSREMLDVATRLAERGVRFELHVFGDKIHNPADDPGFRDEVRERLAATPGVTWHRGTSRGRLFDALPSMHLGWAWRRPELEEHTLELSTKVLEYGACGLPALMAPGPVNVATFGSDYALFCGGVDEIVERLAAVAQDRSLLDGARARVREAAGAHAFDVVRDRWVAPLLADG